MKPDFSKRITGFDRIIANQYREYLLHNSRNLINVLVQTVMMIDYRLCYVLNPLFMALAVIVSTRAATGKWLEWRSYVLSFFVVSLFSYGIKQETVFWFTGAANYTWIMALGLCI